MDQVDVNSIRETAERFSQLIGQQTGSRLGFDLPSLAFFDAFLSEWLDLATVYGEQDARSLEILVVPIASYVGEVLVRSVGAGWDAPVPGDERLPPLKLPTAQRIDLEETVTDIVYGRARPAFHQLATGLSHTPAGDVDGP